MPQSAVSKLIHHAAEAARLEALSELGILDTPPEQSFDDLTWLASQMCQAPIALVSIVDETRQWFKAKCGIDADETSRDVAFCAHAILSDDILEVGDATQDPRFANNALVTGDPHIRFYAGAPLIGRHGHRFGTLCVIDQKPRELSAEQREGLIRLARRASDQLEVRRQQLVALSREHAITQLLESLPGAVVSCDETGTLKEFNKKARLWHGVDVRAVPPHEWAEHFDLYDAEGRAFLATEDIPLARAWRGEQVREARIVVRAKGQAPRYVSCNADPLLSPDGKVLGAVCVMNDVSQLIAAQEDALVETHRFAGAFAAASQGMALVSLTGQWLDVNDAICEMFGHERADLLVIDFQRLTHPEDLEADLGLVADLLAGRRSSYQLDKRYFHRSGRTIYAHLSVSLVRDAKGEPLHFVAQIQDRTQRHQTEQRLRESEQRLRSVLEHSYDAFISVDETEAIVEWNRAAETTFGWRRHEVLGRAMSEVIVPPQLRGPHRTGMQRYFGTGDSQVLDQRLQLPALHRNGQQFPVEMTISVVQVGTQRLFNAFLHDISDRLAAEERLRSSEQHLRTIADNVPAMIGHVGTDLRYSFVNQAYADWFERQASDIVGRHMSEVLRPDHFKALQPRLLEVLAGQAVSFDLDVLDRHQQLRHMHASYIPDRRDSNGAGQGFHLMVHDVTATTRLARVMEEKALTDELTGLPNRAAWSTELTRAIATAKQAGTAVAVMFLDLNGFKQVNDTHGHAAGDVVLREFATRLRASLRTSDFIARLAGDEFVVLLDRVTQREQDFAMVAQKLLAAMKPPIDVGEHRLQVRPSIGFAVQTGPDFDLSLLMQRADEAMYEAKRVKDLAYVMK